MVFGDPDQPHSWTTIDDVAAALAALGTDERAWGSAWHVPTNPSTTIRNTLRDMGRITSDGLAVAQEPRLRRMPRWALSAAGTVVPLLREVGGVLYQFERPFVIDSAATTDAFGLTPTPWEELLEQTAHAWQQQVLAR